MDFEDKSSFFIVIRQIVNTNININCLLNCEISHEVENIILLQEKQKSMFTCLVKIDFKLWNRYYNINFHLWIQITINLRIL
jgi:hypothetical protein